ncbi:hypothetical protein CCMA1212_010021 [Trichoderma ghanense]|uniref:Uncharacterized protein n=1 Tax=Trichoderma ghanense TaxID=65468 RepID=A0ABY2GQI5_9HYPO
MQKAVDSATLNNSNLRTRRLWTPPLLQTRRQRLPLNLISPILTLLVRQNSHIPPLHPPPPRSVYQNRPDSNNDKKPAYARSNDVEMVTNSRHPVPKAARRIRHVLHQRQYLDDTDKSRHHDRDAGQNNGVVQDRHNVSGKSLGRKDTKSEFQTNSTQVKGKLTCKQNGENQNQPDARPLNRLNARNPQHRNLRARVKAQPKHHAQRIHLPRPINRLQHDPQHSDHEPAPLELQLVIRIGRGSNPSGIHLALPGVEASPLRENLLQPLDQLVQHPAVAQAQDDEHRRADARPDDVAHPLKPIKALPQRAARRRHDNARDDDNGAVAEREKGAHGGGPLSGRDEPPRHEVNGRDVVRVQGMAQAEGVGERRGRDEGRVEVQDDADGDPDEGVDGDEDGDDADAVGGEAMEELWRGEVEGHAGGAGSGQGPGSWGS